ncbi:MAG: hypothetical protein JW950_14210 [Deltaproteobacteria bacterium]|nr:hypothetical protein [Deltaproteobacteria bacterium]
MTAYELLARNIGKLQALLKDHEWILNQLKEGDEEPILECCVSGGSRKDRMKETLLEAVHVSEESRKAFKSKQLEALRKKIIEVLAEVA